MNPTLRTAQDFRNEATALVNRAVRESSFNREREAQFDALLRLHDIARNSVDIRPTHLGQRHTAEDIAERARRRHEELRRDPAAMHFFSGAKVFNPLVSQQGTRLSREVFRQNGRALGEVIQMQNFGVDLEGRSYVALDTSTSGDARRLQCADHVLGGSDSSDEAVRSAF